MSEGEKRNKLRLAIRAGRSKDRLYIMNHSWGARPVIIVVVSFWSERHLQKVWRSFVVGVIEASEPLRLAKDGCFMGEREVTVDDATHPSTVEKVTNRSF